MRTKCTVGSVMASAVMENLKCRELNNYVTSSPKSSSIKEDLRVTT